jgi:hypothetical protein
MVPGAGMRGDARIAALADGAPMRTLLAVALAAAGALPAAAFTEADAIAPQTLRIELCRDAGLEIARQADIWRGERDAWLAWRRGLTAELARGAARLAEEHRRARAVEERAVAASRSLVPLGGDAAHVPHIGWGIFGCFEWRRDDTNRAIARRGHGWFDRNGLEGWIAANEAAKAEIGRQLGEGVYAHAFPGGGRLNGQGLDTMIAEREAGIAEVQRLEGAGSYAVPTGLGWTDGNGARAALALPTCRENGPTPCIPAEHRPHDQDALRRIPVAVATDIAIRQLEIDRLRARRAALEAHAAPDLQRLEVERNIHGTLAAEFDQDLAAHRARIGRHIAWLRRAMQQIP